MFKAIINMENLRKFPENGKTFRDYRNFFNEIAQYGLGDYMELVRVFRKYHGRPMLSVDYECSWPNIRFEGNCTAGKMILLFDNAQQYEEFAQEAHKVRDAVAYTEEC